jgi:L-2-hydroxyglutarate oxidase
MTGHGSLVNDFLFEQEPGILHVVNAPSPAATAALAIGKQLAKRVLEQLT